MKNDLLIKETTIEQHIRFNFDKRLIIETYSWGIIHD